MFSLEERLRQANGILAPYAVPHEGRLGRTIPEPPDATRFPFQRDRDRILHSTAFRRLQGKTQVFFAGAGDHYRTRLTHTMEVSQISRSIARALSLNEDLTECIALAHDLGHPPFGHAGEDALDQWMHSLGSHFEHNEQSFRVITLIEKHSSRYKGLNLNREVEEGLLKHSEKHPSGHNLQVTFEAEAANAADEIAYLAHDCDDGLSAELFSMKTLLQIPLAAKAKAQADENGTHIRGALVHLTVRDLIAHSLSLLQKGEKSLPLLRYAPSMQEEVNELKTFLHQHFYTHPKILQSMEEGKRIVLELCECYRSHPPQKVQDLHSLTGGSLEEAVKDYIAGMTDRFAAEKSAELGITRSFLYAKNGA